MTNALQIEHETDGNASSRGSRLPRKALYEHFWLVVPAFALLAFVALLALNLPGAKDYVGADNDDTMRLMEVRDLLSGQSWFDLMQYRLGLSGGTLMHWSRFIDLPIATLIVLFRLFFSPMQAEALALTIWPPLTSVALVFAMGTAAWRLGDAKVACVSLGLLTLFIITSNRFLPGAIDHHNVQLLLIATITAMLMDTRAPVCGGIIAGLAAALAIAIGAETTPHVAIICAVIAVRWAWHGAPQRGFTEAFGLTIALAITAAFAGTVPPHLYSVVTCDNLSLGFYALSAIGGALVFAAARFGSHLSTTGRFVGLAVIGAAVLATARIVAPQCLGNPLAGMDPMLVELWLSRVGEAQSVISQIRQEPTTAGAFYAVGFIALIACAARIWRREQTEKHVVLAALIGISWLIGLVQLRGAIFANMLGILPLSLAVIDMRRYALANPKNIGASVSYLLVALMSAPAVWVVGGVLVSEGMNRIKGQVEAPKVADIDCKSATALAPLSTLPAGVVAASSELGVHILRYTPHRVLSAPYHRNQGGMLTELHIGLASPADAEAFLRGAGVTALAYCDSDGQTKMLARLQPDGLYAQLHENKVPAYLEALPASSSNGLRVFKVRPLSN